MIAHCQTERIHFKYRMPCDICTSHGAARRGLFSRLFRQVLEKLGGVGSHIRTRLRLEFPVYQGI
jgi:hypothetical protein